MTAAQLAAFQANSAITPASMAAVLVGFVFAVLLLWGVWAIRTAWVGWTESSINQRQFLAVCLRFVAMYLVLTFFLVSLNFSQFRSVVEMLSAARLFLGNLVSRREAVARIALFLSKSRTVVSRRCA